MERILSQEIPKYIGKKVRLCGWVNSRRDHGGVIFIDLRDRSGLVQVIITQNSKLKVAPPGTRLRRTQNHNLKLKTDDIRQEWVIEVIGLVRERPKGMENKKIASGSVEVKAEKLTILNKAKTLPFELDKEVSEELRLKYRYLDLRREKMKNNLILRHQVIKLIRDFMDEQGFIEIETPILTKSTPEGARDYIVPSRLQPGKFYALPQSPQQYKQLLMVAGIEKYFQIARCFRDEDTRGDRQPEFTQLDIEMSFVEQEDILKLFEELMNKITKLTGRQAFWHCLTYEEAIKKYKTDKPDLRKNKNELAFCWILDWPLFEWNNEEKRWDPHHHIFTAPKDENFKDAKTAKSWQHDLVLNGYEIAGGSIRIHNRQTQEKIFKLVGLSKNEAQEKFGHLLRAFEYGAPPHGGIALGIDRLLAIITNEPSIRQVIAFPKTGDGQDLMMEVPSQVEPRQLKELNIASVGGESPKEKIEK